MQGIIELNFFAKVEGINFSDGQINILVTNDNGDKINLKGNLDTKDKYTIGNVFQFRATKKSNSERNTAFILEARPLSDIKDIKLVNDTLRLFYPSAIMPYDELRNKVYQTIELIENKVIHDITKDIMDSYSDDFFIYPAATKLHHAYVGGLAYHTIGMINLVEGFLNTYKCLNKDYLYAGVILHDIGKTVEFSGVENTEYALDGQLLGHSVIGSQCIMKSAMKLGFSEREEVLILQHLLISHHGQPVFGAAKKPMTADALLLWYIDSIDSKFRVLEEVLDKTVPGEFTDIIGVLDRMKFYKTK